MSGVNGHIEVKIVAVLFGMTFLLLFLKAELFVHSSLHNFTIHVYLDRILHVCSICLRYSLWNGTYCVDFCVCDYNGTVERDPCLECTCVNDTETCLRVCHITEEVRLNRYVFGFLRFINKYEYDNMFSVLISLLLLTAN